MPIITLPSFEKMAEIAREVSEDSDCLRAPKVAEFRSARLFLKSVGSFATRNQCDRAALSFAASLLVRFLHSKGHKGKLPVNHQQFSYADNRRQFRMPTKKMNNIVISLLIQFQN